MSRITWFVEIVAETVAQSILEMNGAQSGAIDYIKKETERLLKKLRIGKADLDSARAGLSAHLGVDPKHLEFWSVYDYGWRGMVDLVFNVTDPKHRNYKSSVHYPWLPKGRRGVKKSK